MEAGKVVLTDGVKPLREAFALALGEHVGEGPDVTGEGVEFGAVGQDGYSRAIVPCTSDVPPRASCCRVRIRHTLHA
ncbi:hypothetical protein GCM10010254_24810 [Streptomyces chromofuscus]|nr:hypothetical protein GCM10010254_24810 [Streptomyces chromofuscus]